MKKGYIYIFLSTILFSTMEIALKQLSGVFNPIQLTFTRFLLGALILLPLSMKNLKLKKLTLNKNDYIYFSLLGLICVVISMILYQLAVLNTKASVVAVLFSCNPIFVTIFAFILLNEKIYKYNIVSLFFQLVGILFIINPLKMKLNPLGIIFTLLSAVTFAVYGVLGKKKTKVFGGTTVTCFSFLFGGLELAFLALLSNVPFISNILINNGLSIFANIPFMKGYSLNSIPIFIYISIFITGFGYTFYFKSMEETSAATTSLIFFFKPVLAPVLAFFILNESIPFNMLTGILLIICGSIVSIYPTIKREKIIHTINANQ